MQTGRHCKKAMKRKASDEELAEAMYKDIEEIIIKYKGKQEEHIKASDKMVNDEEPAQKQQNRDSEVREVYDLLNLE